MARKRMIDPDFWSDEALGRCKPLARLLFMGLISQADDEGRLRGTPSLIRSQVFPYDEDVTAADVAGMIDVLSGFGLITPYEVAGQRFIHVVNFKKHQTINKPTPSRLPPPPESPLPEGYGSDPVVLPPKLKEEKRRESKGIEESSRVRALASPDSPHGLCVVFLSAMGKSEDEVAPGWFDENRAHARDMLEQGVNADKLTRYVAYERGRGKTSLRLRYVKKDILEWEVAGEPSKDRPRGSPNGKPTAVDTGMDAVDYVGEVMARRQAG